MYYKVLITSGCYSNSSTAATVTVTGQDITSVTNGTICNSGNPATLKAFASGTGGTFNWHSNATAGTLLQSSSSNTYNTPNLSNTTNYYVSVTDGGCTSARYPVTATLTGNINLTSSNFSIPFATSPCAGNASTVNVSSTILPNGSYVVEYSTTGANSLSNQTALMSFNNGNGNFTTASLPNAGTTTITITLVTLSGCNITPTSGNTANINVNNGSPNTTGITVNATNSCSNKNDTVTLSGMAGLTNATYLIEYDVTGANTIVDGEAQMNYASGSGSFVLPLFSNAGTNTVTINTIALLSSPTCKTVLSSGNTANFTNNIQPTVNAGDAQTICDGSTTVVNAGVSATASNYASLAWSTSNGSGTFSNNTTPNALTTATYNIGSNDAATGVIYLTLTAAGNTGCADVSKTVPLTINRTYTWKGATSTDFGTASNWVLGCVPPQGASINFDATPTNICKLDIDRTLDTIGNTGSTANNVLDLNGHKLSVLGKLTFNTAAKINAQAAASFIEFKGSSAQTIPNLLFSNKTVSNLIINNSNGVQMTDSIFITHTLAPVAGVFNSNDVLTLRSTASLTARVLPITNIATASITEDVIVERYLPASGNRAWRLLSSPLDATTAPTIFDSWQEGVQGSGGAYRQGYGTFVSRPGAGLSNGYDSSSNSTSLQYWNGTTLVTPTTTNNATTDKITNNGAAWFLFVRGDKTVRPELYPATGNTTLRQKGILNQGAKTLGATGTSFSMIPNPYASPLNFDLVSAANGNISSFYIWDASLNTIGGYRAITKVGSNYIATPTTGNATNDNLFRYLQSGQAFLVPVNAQLNFTEDMKTDNLPTVNVYKTTSLVPEELMINLYKGSTSLELVDGVRIWFDSSYSLAKTAEDVLKPRNINEILSVGVDTFSLAIAAQPLPTVNDTLQLLFDNTTLNNYQFEFQPNNFNTLLQPYLLDGYMNSLTPISTTSASTYNFTITNATGSWNKQRFKIVFANSNPLDVSNIELKATASNNEVKLQWEVNAEENLATFQLQRSVDGGKTFSSINSQNVKTGNTLYQYVDNNLQQTAAWYRVKATTNDNALLYSNIEKVRTGSISKEIEIYPNPVRDNRFSIDFSTIAEGKYDLTIYNLHGQKIHSQSLLHDGVTKKYLITLPSNLATGNYTVEIMKNLNKVATTKLIIEK